MKKKDNDPCWDSHKMVGMKKKGNRMVPNCVPKESKTFSSFRQVSELKKSTLASYIGKASHDVATKSALTRHFATKSQSEKDKENFVQARKDDETSNKMFAKSWKRRQGIQKAANKLAGGVKIESVEDMDEGYVKSSNKKLKGANIGAMASASNAHATGDTWQQKRDSLLRAGRAKLKEDVVDEALKGSRADPVLRAAFKKAIEKAKQKKQQAAAATNVKESAKWRSSSAAKPDPDHDWDRSPKSTGGMRASSDKRGDTGGEYDHSSLQNRKKAQVVAKTGKTTKASNTSLKNRIRANMAKKQNKPNLPEEFEQMDEAIPKSKIYALVHSSSKKIVAKGNKQEMMKKMKEVNAKEKGSHHLGMTNRGQVGNIFGEEVEQMSEGGNYGPKYDAAKHIASMSNAEIEKRIAFWTKSKEEDPRFDKVANNQLAMLRAQRASRIGKKKVKEDIDESTGVTDYNPKSQGGTRKELIAKYRKTKNPEHAAAARRAGATQKELMGEAAYMGKGNHKPGWMLRADPELAKKFKDIEDRKKAQAKYAGKLVRDGKVVKEEDYKQIDEKGDFWNPDATLDAKMGGRSAAIMQQKTAGKKKDDAHLALLKRLAASGKKIAAESKQMDDDPNIPFAGPYRKAGEVKKDKYGNVIKPKNIAKHLAKQGMAAASMKKEAKSFSDFRKDLDENV